MSEAFDFSGFHSEFTREALARGFSLNVIHETKSGPVTAWERESAGPVVYLSAGIHGDEPAGPLALLELMRSDFFCPGIHWLLCPALNPDGLVAGTRENDMGVDLNRDYFIRESGETGKHAAWLDTIPQPSLFISLHEDWETAGFYLYELNLTAGPTAHAHRILEAVKPWFDPEPGPEIDGHPSYEPGWIYHPSEPDIPTGWPEAIYIIKKGCPLSFTFESPSGKPMAHRIAALAAAVRATCEETCLQKGRGIS